MSPRKNKHVGVHNESVLVRSLEALTGVKNRQLSFPDYLDELDNVLELPFSLHEVEIPGTKLPVLGELLNLTKRTFLFQMMEEYRETPVLVSDSVIGGVDGLFFCQVLNDLDDIGLWTKRLKRPQLFINTCRSPQLTVMCSSFKSFI